MQCRGKRFSCFYLGFLFCLAFSVLASGLAQAQEPASSPTPEQNWSALDNLLNQLQDEAQNLSNDSEKLQGLLSQAQQQLIILSSKLDESRIAGKELSTSLAQSANSLTDSIELLNKERSRLALELWLWRGGTVLAVVGVILALMR